MFTMSRGVDTSSDVRAAKRILVQAVPDVADVPSLARDWVATGGHIWAGQAVVVSLRRVPAADRSARASLRADGRAAAGAVVVFAVRSTATDRVVRLGTGGRDAAATARPGAAARPGARTSARAAAGPPCARACAGVDARVPAEDVVLVPTPVLELPPIVTTEPLLELLAPVQRLCCWMVVRNVPHPVSSAAVRAGMHCGCSVVGNVMQHAESIAQLMPAAGGLPASSEVIGLPVAHASAAIPSINAASAPATHTFRSFMFEPFVGSARCHR